MSAIALEHLAANVSNLKGRDLDFAQSLLQQSKTRLLSPKQIHWVSVLAEKASGHTQAKTSNAQKAQLFSSVRDMFDRAVGTGARKMAVRLEDSDGVKLKLSLASDRVRLHFAEQGENGRYFGYIDANGEFNETRSQPSNATMLALIELDKDPKAAAISYGRRTGTCCMCGRELTNGVSIEAGIGPICAEKLGF